MSQRIIIKVIDHKSQRYETVGDWEFRDDDDTLVISVSDLGDVKMNCLVAIHELVEALLCNLNDPEITTAEVDSFDMEFEKNRKEEDNSEPGDCPEAPYYKQHKLATVIEKTLAGALAVDWIEYEKRIDSL